MRLNHPTCFSWALAAALLIPGGAARAQDAPAQAPPRLEALVDSIFASHVSAAAPGCAVAVMQHGEVLLKRAYGLANISLNVPMTPAVSTWIPYSEARVFVALAVAMLAREGAIALDDPIRRHVSEVPAYAADVRIRHLIHHTSGLADYGVLAGPGWMLYDRMSEDEFFRIIGRWGRLGFEPGTDVMYSNTDYALLKILVERVTGGSLHTYLDEKLLQPLGMRSTRIGASQADVFPNHALFHEAADSGYRAVLRYRESPVGGISVTTSVDDLVRWEQGLRDRSLGLDALLAPLREGAPPPEEGFAFGIYRMEQDGLAVEVHRGVGEYMYIVRVPATGVSVATICTAYAGMWVFGPAVAGLFSRTTAAPLTADVAPAQAAPQPAVPLSPAELQRFAGEYRDPAGTGPTVRLAVVEGVLQVTIPTGATHDTRPIGDGTFELVLSPAMTLRLVLAGTDSTMTLTALDAATGEAEPPLTRWIPPQPSAAMLGTYPGVYLGDDVDVTLYVNVSDDRVLMASRSLPATVLEPTRVPDRYHLSQWAGTYEVTFHRDVAGDVTHLTLDATRVKGARYTRVRP